MKPSEVLSRVVGDALTRDREYFERQYNHYDGLGFHTDAELAEMYGALSVVLFHMRMLSEMGS